jgi:hypothetical protein
MVFRHQLLQGHHLQFRLGRVGRLQHGYIIKKAPNRLEALSAV